jgi:hypothetical protein
MPDESIDELRDEVVAKVDEIADNANASVTDAATAEVAITAAAIIVGETRDDIAALEEDTRSQEDKISWLMKTVESQQAELDRLRSSSIQTEVTADVAMQMAETALEQSEPDLSIPNPSVEIAAPEVVINPEQVEVTPPPPSDIEQTDSQPESADGSQEAEVGPPILEPVNQVLQRRVIML